MLAHKKQTKYAAKFQIADEAGRIPLRVPHRRIQYDQAVPKLRSRQARLPPVNCGAAAASIAYLYVFHDVVNVRMRRKRHGMVSRRPKVGNEVVQTRFLDHFSQCKTCNTIYTYDGSDETS